MDGHLLHLISRYPHRFREHIVVDTDSGPRALDSVLDDWQRSDFVALDAGWRRVAGQATTSGYTRAWLERPRGHSKTSDLAVSAAWVLAFSQRRLVGIAAAADREQGRLLRDAVSRLVALNPWLAKTLDVQQNRVLNVRTGSELQIITSDANSAYGLLPDFLICDEVTHWRSRDLWDSLLSAAAKRSHCLMLCILNSGFVDTWQFKTREAIRTDPSWYFSRLDGPCASWITQDRLEEQKRLLPGFQYSRLWGNEWTCGTDSPLITESDLCAAINIDEPMSFDPQYGPYLGGLDVGTRHDRTALVVIGMNLRGPRLRLAAVRSWNPAKYGGTLPLSVVERDILEIAHNSQLHGIAYDPQDATMLVERLTARGVPMYRYPWSAQKKERMALYAIESFHHSKIDLYPDDDLLRDLRRTTLVERAGRVTFSQPRDEHGHCDTASAFLMALVWARCTRADYLGELDTDGLTVEAA